MAIVNVVRQLKLREFLCESRVTDSVKVMPWWSWVR